MPKSLHLLFPPGSVTLAALHDVGKISAGFLQKCPRWLVQNGLAAEALMWTTAETDHSVVTQFFLQQLLRPSGAELWAVAAGAHHGRIHGKRLRGFNVVPDREGLEEQERKDLADELSGIFGPLPARAPREDSADLWLVSGLISVADWIASDENYFPVADGLSLADARARAARSLERINFEGSRLCPDVKFDSAFGLAAGPNGLQSAVYSCASAPGLLIVEGPMGCGKTEAALWAAHRLASSGSNDGIYFALPTQVTSNRIHTRVASFLARTASEPTNLRLAHAASWLEDNQTLRIVPAYKDSAPPSTGISDARDWFASRKHALLARYGVGTVDQALQAVVAVRHFFVRRFGLAGKVVILDEVHSYDIYTGTLITQLIRELLALGCSVIILSATLTRGRRNELLAAAGVSAAADSDATDPGSDPYPLITHATGPGDSKSLPVPWFARKRIHLCMRSFGVSDVVQELLERAESGQHVLYLRNTVAEAQDAYRAVAGTARAGTVRLALLHSRFPFFRRQSLEEEWLKRLGTVRPEDGLGSVLVATQVVEQSVDIDLDFIVSDLAPTDMLLQRMGRLWRHERAKRSAHQPEFWIAAPDLNPAASADQLKSALGKSGRVYAPYVLLRTAEVFSRRESIDLPQHIRELLESTYAAREAHAEPVPWRELRCELERQKEQMSNLAVIATRIFRDPLRPDDDGLQTRWGGLPTCPVVLLKAVEPLTGSAWRLTCLDGSEVEAQADRWNLGVARAIHRNLVRAPSYIIPRQDPAPWLSVHVPGRNAWAVAQPDGTCVFPDARGESGVGYDPVLGLFTQSKSLNPKPSNDDDEFDY